MRPVKNWICALTLLAILSDGWQAPSSWASCSESAIDQARKGRATTMVEAEIIEDDEMGADDGADFIPDDARQALSNFDHHVRTLVAEHPVAAVVGALTAGFLVGRLLR
jgi:hypothetical protein